MFYAVYLRLECRMNALPVPWSFMEVLNNILLAALVLFILGCCVAFVLAILGWDRRSSRAEIGRVSGRWLDERGRNRRPE